ncbi:hypothetical protein ACWCRD_42710 [Streptomyces sp. NPDC002092]
MRSWERRLDYGTINESIFGGYRVKVDALLADGVPDLLQQFSAVYRRLQEAADSAPERDVNRRTVSGDHHVPPHPESCR